MRYIKNGLLAVCLLLGLSACNTAQTGQETIETNWTTEQMATAIWNAGASLSGTGLLAGNEVYDVYVTGSYGLEATEIIDGAIWVAGGASAQEVAVFQMTDADEAEAATEVLESYLQNRIASFMGYLPEEVALLENAQVEIQGMYVALLSCEDIEAAQSAFFDCFTEEPPREESPRFWAEPPMPEDMDEPASEPPQNVEEDPLSAIPESDGKGVVSEPSVFDQEPELSTTPIQSEQEPTFIPSETLESPTLQETSIQPNTDLMPWSYDENRLLSAWAIGNWDDLQDEDQTILDICQEVISTVIPVNGNAYEQELAVHDWMIAHGSYDSNRLSNLPDFQENPNNDNPYGFLVDGKGICLGYTRTFQLFMDLLGIECITVEGMAYNYTADHAWNQVRLDGEWYCVDVTWDDPTTSGTLSERNAHRFFNVTSDHMRNTNHQWDEKSIPEATGITYTWQ